MKNKNLEMVRGAAAFLVVIGHLSSLTVEIDSHRNHFINFFSTWGTQAVIIFFILSGIVIHSSFEKSPRSTGKFLLQRVVRLHPSLMLSVALAVLIEILILHQKPAATTIFFNVIPLSTMSGYIAPVLWNSNPVIWSLTFEVFFYLIFALAIIHNKKIRKNSIPIWLVIGVCCIGLYYLNLSTGVLQHFIKMFAFSTTWIIGFYIWSLRNYFSVNLPIAIFCLFALPLISRLHLTNDYYDPIKYCLFAITSIPIFLYLLNTDKSTSNKNSMLPILVPILCIYVGSSIFIFRDPSYILSIKIIYIFFPFFAFSFFSTFIKGQFVSVLRRIVRPFFSYLGKYSYTLYLFHFPVIVGVNDYLDFSLPIRMIAIIIILILIAYLIDHKLQPYLNRKVNYITRDKISTLKSELN